MRKGRQRTKKKPNNLSEIVLTDDIYQYSTAKEPSTFSEERIMSNQKRTILISPQKLPPKNQRQSCSTLHDTQRLGLLSPSETSLSLFFNPREMGEIVQERRGRTTQ